MRASPPSQRRLLLQLPSKKILPLIAVCIVVVSIIALIIFYNPNTAIQPQKNASLAVVNQANVSGLTNRVYQKIESELTQLATSSATSTGANALAVASTTNAQNASSTRPTATQVLSQEFIQEYLAMKQPGQAISTSSIQTLIPNLIANGNVAQYIPQAKVFTLQDLTVSNNNSAAAFETYGNALASVFLQHRIPSNLNELEIFQTAVNSNNPADLAGLAIIKTAYSGIVAGLASVKVPSQAATLHLALLNDFSQTLNDIEGMQKLFTDPITAVAAIQNYETTDPNILGDLTAFGPLFTKYGATFSSTEPGSMFTKQ